MSAKGQNVIVATGNLGKLREIGEILSDMPLVITSLRDHWDPLPQIPETGSTFEENARLKAAWVHERAGEWSLADDSGLEVDALDGAPGVYSARYAGEGAGDEANLRKLLEQMDTVSEEQRTARFRCVVVLMTAPDRVYVAQGVCNGRIVREPLGAKGFGYDPVFVPDGFSHTFAQLDQGVKNAISHRGKALMNLRKELVRLDEL
ncbi:MAG: RdgB/HAM1 family non-canonical purine NTP pyrophosphatase [Chitinivibrionales bacterium]|nr:RdgB/HAM1 family non-canonical purine NTP pyrophosphatase [Chitinivibrionales bacterium]